MPVRPGAGILGNVETSIWIPSRSIQTPQPSVWSIWTLRGATTGYVNQGGIEDKRHLMKRNFICWFCGLLQLRLLRNRSART